MFKSKNIFFGVLSVAFFVGCDSKKENVNPQVNVKATKSYFVTNKFNDSSNLYSFDYTTNKVTHEISKPDSSDGILFQKYDASNNLQGIYFTERFNQKPSRVTFYQAQKNDSGNENTEFPMNLRNIMFIGDKLIGIGYNKGEIVQTDLLMQTHYLKKIEVDKLNAKNNVNPSESSSNLSSLLYANGEVFTVSQGSYQDQNIKPYIYQLSNDLKTVENSWPIDGCFNAAAHFKVIDESKLIVQCNPYNNTANQNMINVFLIDTATLQSTNQPSIIKILEKERTEGGIQQFEIGGISDDRNSIFISEKEKLNFDDKWENKKIMTSYWFDLSNPSNIQLNDESRKTLVNIVSGSVTYNYAAKKYLFSCMVQANSTCTKGIAAVSQNKDASDHIQVDFGVKVFDDIKFPIPVF